MIIFLVCTGLLVAFLSGEEKPIRHQRRPEKSLHTNEVSEDPTATQKTSADEN